MNNNNLIGIVNKPQFDENVFKVGQAIHIGGSGCNRHGIVSVDCIITETKPLYLVASYYNKSIYKMDSIKIEIGNVLNSLYEISLLEEVTSNGN